MNNSLDYVDDLYVQYVRDPSTVTETWRQYFEQFQIGPQLLSAPAEPPVVGGGGGLQRPTHATARWDTTVRPAMASRIIPATIPIKFATDQRLWAAQLQDRVDQLVREIPRPRATSIAQLDPLGTFAAQPARSYHQNQHGITNEDLQAAVRQQFPGQHPRPQRCKSVLEKMRATYCRHIGAQFMHIDNRMTRDWLQKRMELTQNRTRFDP